MATATRTGECLFVTILLYIFNKEIKTRHNDYFCISLKIIHTLRMLLILTIKSKIFPKCAVTREANGETHSHSKHFQTISLDVMEPTAPSVG